MAYRDNSFSQYRRTRRFWYVGFGLFFALVGLIILCVSFTTDYWLEYDVDRDELDPTKIVAANYGYTPEQYAKMYNEDSRYYTRNRGLFRTCFKGNDTWFFKEADPSDRDGSCLREISYDFDDVEVQGGSPGYEEENFDLRKHLMRCHLAFFILGIVLLAIAVIVTTIGCWCLWITAFIISCVVAFLAALFMLLGMVFFHWYKYLEENELDFDPYGRKAWHQELFLDQFTSVEYKYSYILGWVAFFCAFLAFIFFGLAAWSTRRKKVQENAGITRPVKGQKTQQQQVVAAPAPAPAQQQVPAGDGTVYVINHYPSTEKLIPNQQPQYVPQPAPQPQPQMYPTRPVHTNHSVYQSVVPRYQ